MPLGTVILEMVLLSFVRFEQLQLVESSLDDSLEAENGEVSLDGMKVASIDRLKFDAANEDYLKMQKDIQELHDEIVRLDEDPEDEDNQEDYRDAKEEVERLVDWLQPKLDKYNKLKEEFAEDQKRLFDTAKRIAQFQGKQVTDRMRFQRRQGPRGEHHPRRGGSGSPPKSGGF